MNKVISVALVLVGLLNFTPIIGVLGGERLQTLYGVVISDQNLMILMRHRAVMLGMIGAFMIYAAFRPTLTLLGLSVGLISMVTFLLFALSSGVYNSELKRLVYIDSIASLILLIATVLWYMRNRATDSL